MERIKCLCGMEADARAMFEIEADEKIKIAFQQAAFEDEKEEIEAVIGEDRYLIIENMKQLYDYSQLQSVLNGSIISQTPECRCTKNIKKICIF